MTPPLFVDPLQRRALGDRGFWSRALGGPAFGGPALHPKRGAARVFSVGVALGALAALGCSGSRPFGDLPDVSITLPEEQTAPPRVRADAPPEEEPSAESEQVPDAPDPPALRQKEQLDLDLVFDKGEVRLTSSKRITETQEVLTPRKMGRFAVELYLGPELLERVRFDFPLLADDASSALEQGLQTSATVRIPWVERATRALVLDRKTRKVLALPWPLPEGANGAAPASD